MDRTYPDSTIPPLEIAKRLRNRRGLSPDVARRLSSIAAMARAAVERSEHRLPFFKHLVIQFERAIGDEERADDTELRKTLAEALSALAAGDLLRAEHQLKLAAFPWQRSGFVYFTARQEWRERTKRAPDDSGPVCLTELAPRSDDKLVPYQRDERRIIFVFSGNRQAYSGSEHEPASSLYGQDLQANAEAYVARAGSLVARLFAPEDLRQSKLVMPVYGAMRSRHEQRLIHFALSQDPSFVHPSIEASARAIFRVLFLRRAADGSYTPKTEPELLATPFRAVTHSYGSSAIAQTLTRIRALAGEHGISPAMVTRYFSQGVSVQFGGYRLEISDAEDSLPRHAVISLLDEIALGSPSSPPRYTSPVIQPAWVWQERFCESDLWRMARAEFDEIKSDHRALGPGLTLWSPVFRGFEAYDEAGNKLADLEGANGHFLGAYVQHALRRLPELVELLRLG